TPPPTRATRCRGSSTTNRGLAVPTTGARTCSRCRPGPLTHPRSRRRSGGDRATPSSCPSDRGAVAGRGRRGGGAVVSRSVDAVIVGSGHNGLVAGAYLARAGWEVEVLERAQQPGG